MERTGSMEGGENVERTGSKKDGGNGRVLIVVDMQKDFVDGSLGTAEAQAIIERTAEKIRTFDGTVLFTMDTHGPDYLDTQEGKFLPVVHCVKGTPGWELISPLKELCEAGGYRRYEKPAFGSVELARDLKGRYDAGTLSSVELIGVCTDICVISNALLIKAFLPELPVSVDPVCCAGVTKEKHEAALETMRSCQILLP